MERWIAFSLFHELDGAGANARELRQLSLEEAEEYPALLEFFADFNGGNTHYPSLLDVKIDEFLGLAVKSEV